MADLLAVEGLWAGYGDATVLEDISFRLQAGGSLALLGRNGMGKTTLLTTLMGATRQLRGQLHLEGQDLQRVPSHGRAQAGLGWVPQERGIFTSLSVQENLTVAARPGPWNLERVYATFAALKARRTNRGGALSGGEQQMLAIGRALMQNPRLLLLDEPLEGLAPLVAQELLGIIAKMVQERSMAVILVEQHAQQILPLMQQALVLERGRMAYLGPSQTLLQEPARLEGWLGMAAR